MKIPHIHSGLSYSEAKQLIVESAKSYAVSAIAELLGRDDFEECDKEIHAFDLCDQAGTFAQQCVDYVIGDTVTEYLNDAYKIEQGHIKHLLKDEFDFHPFMVSYSTQKEMLRYSVFTQIISNTLADVAISEGFTIINLSIIKG